MKIRALIFTLAFMLAAPGFALAHSPLFDCFDNGDGTVMCQGGFSDGSSASGVKIHVKGADGKNVEDLVLDANSECTFKKPEGAYSVEMNAGEGHSIVISGENIVE